MKLILLFIGVLFFSGCLDKNEINFKSLELIDGKYYKKGNDEPFTGISVQKKTNAGIQLNLYPMPSSFLHLVKADDPIDLETIFSRGSRSSLTYSKKIVRTHERGILNGPYLELYENDTIKIRGWFEKGEFHGKFYLYHSGKKGHCEITIDGSVYFHASFIESMEFAAGKPHGSYERNADFLDLSCNRGKKYVSATFRDGVLEGPIRLSNEQKKQGEESFNSMSPSQERALRKAAEDLYDKCEEYGKSYDSRC